MKRQIYRAAGPGRRLHPARRGSSVLGATALLCLIAVTATVTLPRWARSYEGRTAAEAVDYLINVRRAQAAYHRAHGRYADHLDKLDLAHVPPTYFGVGPMEPLREQSFADSWSLTLQRYDVRSLFGCYAITCTHEGFSVTTDSQYCLTERAPRAANLPSR